MATELPLMAKLLSCGFSFDSISRNCECASYQLISCQCASACID